MLLFSLTVILARHGRRQMIKQVWIPYWEWEDFINGMWSKSKDETADLKTAIEFTGDHIRYGNAMKKVIIAWPRTMMNSLTNSSINKRAFLGHCAASFELSIPEYITRMAWKQLTDEQRFNADKVAQQTIDEWTTTYESRNKPIHQSMASALLF